MKTHVAFIQERGDVGNAMIVALIAKEAADKTINLVPMHDLGQNVVGRQVFNGILPDGQRLRVYSMSRLRDLGSAEIDVTRFHSLNGLKHKGMPLHEVAQAQSIVDRFPNCHIRFYLQERKHDSYQRE